MQKRACSYSAQVQRARPLVHCFGHVHSGYGQQRCKVCGDDGKESEVLFINAAIDDAAPEPAVYFDL